MREAMGYTLHTRSNMLDINPYSAIAVINNGCIPLSVRYAYIVAAVGQERTPRRMIFHLFIAPQHLSDEYTHSQPLGTACLVADSGKHSIVARGRQ